MTFIMWSISGNYRTTVEAEENYGHYLVYGDESYIVLETGNSHQPRYVVRIANGEEEFDTKYDAERFLWDNHASFNYEQTWRVHGKCNLQYRSKTGLTKFRHAMEFDSTFTGEEWEEIRKMGVHNTITCVDPKDFPCDMEDLIDLKYISLNTEMV